MSPAVFRKKVIAYFSFLEKRLECTYTQYLVTERLRSG